MTIRCDHERSGTEYAKRPLSTSYPTPYAPAEEARTQSNAAMFCREHLEEMLDVRPLSNRFSGGSRGRASSREEESVHESVKGMATLPDKVWAVGILREGAAAYHSPIIAGEGLGLAPLSVLDADGERAVPVFTTHDKAERGILHFMSEEERTENTVGAVRVDLDELLRAMREAPTEAPKVDYVGVNMGEGGVYPLIRP